MIIDSEVDGKFSIDGDLTGNRTNGGPMGWSIDSSMAEDLDVQYKSDQSLSGREILAGGLETGNYQYVRESKKVSGTFFGYSPDCSESFERGGAESRGVGAYLERQSGVRSGKPEPDERTIHTMAPSEFRL